MPKQKRESDDGIHFIEWQYESYGMKDSSLKGQVEYAIPKLNSKYGDVFVRAEARGDGLDKSEIEDLQNMEIPVSVGHRDILPHIIRFVFVDGYKKSEYVFAE